MRMRMIANKIMRIMLRINNFIKITLVMLKKILTLENP